MYNSELSKALKEAYSKLSPEEQQWYGSGRAGQPGQVQLTNYFQAPTNKEHINEATASASDIAKGAGDDVIEQEKLEEAPWKRLRRRRWDVQEFSMESDMMNQVVADVPGVMQPDQPQVPRTDNQQTEAEEVRQ